MNGEEQKEALGAIKMMLGAKASGSSAIGPDTVKAYLIAVSDHPLTAIRAACEAFIKGNVIDYDFDYFPPNAPRLAIEVGKWAEAQRLFAASKSQQQRMVVYPVGELPPPPLKPLGPIRMEVEGIMRDTSEWTFEEKEHAINTGKMPPSRVDPIRNPAITTDKTRPLIQRMSDK